MNKFRRTYLNLLAGSSLLLFSASLFPVHAASIPSGEVLEGRVLYVADGDTVSIRTEKGREVRIRFLGIDAPELSQSCGRESKENLKKLVKGKNVRVDVSTEDRYGRVVGRVMLNGRDINLAQIESGYAWFYSHYARQMFRGDPAKYEKAQEYARNRKLGLWREKAPKEPWDYRAEARSRGDLEKRSSRSYRNR